MRWTAPPQDARQALALWAWEADLDEAERSALSAAPEGSHWDRLAWQPVALWGPQPEAAPLRKLRRAAMALIDARDLTGELGWAPPGAEADAMRSAVERLGALSARARLAGFWDAAARVDMGALAQRVDRLADPGRMGRAPWSGFDASRRAWQALMAMDWEESAEEDEALAARAWAFVERGSLAGAAQAAACPPAWAKRL